MKNLLKKSSLSLVIGSILLSGCSSTFQATHDARKNNKITQENATNLVNKSADLTNDPLFQVSNNVYVDNKPITSVSFNEKKQLPNFFGKKLQ